MASRVAGSFSAALAWELGGNDGKIVEMTVCHSVRCYEDVAYRYRTSRSSYAQ